MALKGERKINISYYSSDKDTATDNDSAEARLPSVPKTVLTNHQENFGIYHLGQITKEDRATFIAFKTNNPDHGYNNIKDLYKAVQTLHLKYFHSDVNNLFAVPLNWFSLMISLLKYNFWEELQEVVNVFKSVEAMGIKLFRDTSKKW